MLELNKKGIEIILKLQDLPKKRLNTPVINIIKTEPKSIFWRHISIYRKKTQNAINI